MVASQILEGLRSVKTPGLLGGGKTGGALMKRPFSLVHIVVMTLVSLSPAMQAHGGEPSIDEASVRALLEARSLESLDHVFSKAAREDEALKAVYQARRLVLNNSRGEELRFLEALPATERGLQRVYELTHPSESKLGEDPRIADVVYGMFERAARYAQRYKSGHRRVLQLCLFSDGELAETAWEWCDWLLQHDSERALAAIRSLPIEDQRRMCSGETAEGLTVKEAIQKCATDL
jgi:hypothetical protein